ncbi:serine/threonine protein kinase [Rubripirellula sp.]|nr:serine/threonine protein kinase [Rubripirellula sp.]
MKPSKNQDAAGEVLPRDQRTSRLDTGNRSDETRLQEMDARIVGSSSKTLASQGDGAWEASTISNKTNSIEYLEPICEEFETAWRLKQEPKLGEFLNRADELEHDLLLIELLQIELWWRREANPTPTADEYKQLLPQHAAAIETAFSRFQNKSLAQAPDARHDAEPQTSDANSDVQATTPPNQTARAPSDLIPSGTLIGDYELLGEIARGGMGVVYKARHVKLNRIVALKMILAGQFSNSDAMERFQSEAEATAKIDHPGIIPIFEIGQHDGLPYFSMGFVDGESLQDRIDRGPLPPKEAANVALNIAEAIHFAHQHGVIHRDLKPANILFDSRGEPRVTDFGLAKQIDETLAITKTGAVMGTPGFMPPEQASGKTNAIDRRSDVYALGAVLYAMVTGRPPFTGASTTDVLLQVIDADPISPQQLNRKIDRDLSTICMKCLQKNKHSRYDSAVELAGDLIRYLNNRPIFARPVSRITRTFRWCKRHKAQTFWITAFLASLFYPLLLGLHSVLTLHAATFSFTTPDGRKISINKPESTFGPVVEMPTIDQDGNLVQHPVAVLPGIESSRMTELEKIVDFAFEEPLIIRFQSGRISKDQFRTGGRIKVWIELLKYGEQRKCMLPHVFDLRADPNDPALHQADFVLLRSERDDEGWESWRLSMQSRVDRTVAQRAESESRRAISPIAEATTVNTKKSNSVRSENRSESHRYPQSVWTQPITLTDSQFRELVNTKLGPNVFEEHFENTEKHILHGMRTQTSTKFGTLPQTDKVRILYEQRMGKLLNLEGILTRKGIPIDTELAEVELRIKCQFLPEQPMNVEAPEETAEQADAVQSDAVQSAAEKAESDAEPSESQ